MAASNSLKQEIRPLIVTAILGHLLVFAWVVAAPWEVAFSWRKELATTLPLGVAIFTSACLIALIARGLFPSGLRDSLIHWRWNDPLPGSRAFSEIGPRDPRVDMKKLRAKFGNVPRSGKNQNTKFYEIYDKYRDSIPVVDAHKSYLAARDVAIITLVFSILLPAATFGLTGNWISAAAYAAFLIATFIGVSFAAKVYGQRLVENTLALACQEKR